MSEQLDDGGVTQGRTVAAAKSFIEAKTRSYEIPANSGNAMITALNKVFAVEQDPDAVDLTTVDMDDVFRRFRIKSPELNDTSFSTYKSRVRRAITMHAKWLDGEDWLTSAKANKPAGRPARSGASSRSASGSRRAHIQHRYGLSENSPSDGEIEDALFDYRVRLVDSNATAILRLPLTFTSADADRMVALIKALAVPMPSEPTPGE